MINCDKLITDPAINSIRHFKPVPPLDIMVFIRQNQEVGKKNITKTHYLKIINNLEGPGQRGPITASPGKLTHGRSGRLDACKSPAQPDTSPEAMGFHTNMTQTNCKIDPIQTQKLLCLNLKLVL